MEEQLNSTPSSKLEESSNDSDVPHLARIEAMVTGLDRRTRDDILARNSWRIFGHLLLIQGLFCIGLARFLAEYYEPELIFAWLIGWGASLGVWHGLSLRSWPNRWHRSGVAGTVFVACLLVLADYVDEVFVSDLLFFQGLLLAFVTAIVAWMIGRVTSTGIAAPDGPHQDPKPATLTSYLQATAAVAVAILYCQVIGSYFTDSGAVEEAVEGQIVGALYMACFSAIITISWISVFRGETLARRLWGLLVMAVSVFVLNTTYLTVLAAYDGNASTMEALMESIPEILLFLVLQLFCPVLTAFVLTSTGHHMKTRLAASREREIPQVE